MPENSKDDKYWRRRAKNNEAAKRSREAKRNKEDEVLQRVHTLEKENDLLKYVSCIFFLIYNYTPLPICIQTDLLIVFSIFI
jgi:hypothetical protein